MMLIKNSHFVHKIEDLLEFNNSDIIYSIININDLLTKKFI